MSTHNSTAPAKPDKPTDDFPLFPHATGRWAKKIKGQTHYFGPWADPAGALQRYQDFIDGKPVEKSAPARQPGSAKPAKPYPEFPLFPHATKRWAKKIRGQTHYFGPWDDPDGALANYLEKREDLHAGRTPRPDTDGLTAKQLVNAFLNHKQARVDAGELSPLTWLKYKQTAAVIIENFGKQRLVADLRPDDFAKLKNAMSKKWGALRVRDFIQHIRSVFKFGWEAELMPTPMRFGPGFARPSKKTLRLDRAKKGPQMFEAEELRHILAAAGRSMRAMVLLGINAGFGNSDCARLPLTALDLAAGWVRFPRPKTGIDRRCPLWPETVAALRDVLAHRPEPKDEADAGLVFLTKFGMRWHKDIEDSPLSKEMRKLLDSLGVGGRRNFYAIRHTVETVAGEAKDQVAVDFIMGHARDDMGTVYRERIGDARLEAVAAHVRAWLFGRREAARDG